jgi:hypothetical protein
MCRHLSEQLAVPVPLNKIPCQARATSQFGIPIHCSTGQVAQELQKRAGIPQCKAIPNAIMADSSV